MSSASLKQPTIHAFPLGVDGTKIPGKEKHTLCYAFDCEGTLSYEGSVRAPKSGDLNKIDCKGCHRVFTKYPQIYNKFLFLQIIKTRQGV